MNSTLKSIGLFVNESFPFIRGVAEFLSGRPIIGLARFAVDVVKYSLANSTPFVISAKEFYPCLTDRFNRAGDIPRHYFFQDIWAAKKILASGETLHYDVGSRLDGFISHCLIFCKVVMLDVRPLPTHIQNLEFFNADFTKKVALSEGSISSISALHSIEHFGLGRYGDPLDPLGHVKAINELIRIAAPGGNIYFSAPIGRRRLVFNAHRIFDPRDIPELFEGCELIDFAAIDDDNMFLQSPNLADLGGLTYGCGLFHFRKHNSAGSSSA